MTAPYRKKLIEVALPLKAINEASAREKGNPFLRGHPRNLHQWWARRPLAACRAVLFTSLVDDPDSDPRYRKADGTIDTESAAKKRAELFSLIEELVQWENSNNPRIINAARAEIARCVASRKIELAELEKDTTIFGAKRGKKHPKGPVSGEGVTAWEVLLMKARPEVVNAFLAEYAPPVLDPFCGGGSIPLEAQRLGLRAHASDLNPIAVLITKALIEIPQKFANRQPMNPEWHSKSDAEKATTIWQGAQGLAEDVRYYGLWMHNEAQKRIGHLYPKIKITAEVAKGRPDLKEYVGTELPVLAWLWARTVASPNPATGGAHIPLVKSFSLCGKPGKEAWIKPIIDRSEMSYEFTVRVGKANIPPGTIGRHRGDRCLLTDQPVSREHIRNEGAANRLGVRLMAVVADGRRGRVFLPPGPQHESVARSVSAPSDVPDSDIVGDTRYLTPTTYGMTKYHHLFTNRQLVILTTLSDLVSEARQRVITDYQSSPLKDVDDRPLADGGIGQSAYADAVALYLALGIDKAADYSNTLCTWNPANSNIGHLFTKQALPMAWDFAEANILYGGLAFHKIIESITESVEAYPMVSGGCVHQMDSTAVLPIKNALISTDPPYYDNVPYADLSDFFYVWLRRSIASIAPALFSTLLTPKSQELVASPHRHGGNKETAKRVFEASFEKAFFLLHASMLEEYPLTAFYAFKQTEGETDEPDHSSEVIPISTGWETMLEGMNRAGFLIDGTWPVRTERKARMRDLGSNALASSIVLVCRPRPADAPLATRKEFMGALRHEMPEALRNLQQGNIAPVDLAQAAIGPGMALFTRYSKVVESDGSAMTVRTALGIINQALGEVLAEQEGDFDADTRWALSWFEQFGTEQGPFGEADVLARAKNTAINGLVEAGVVKAKGGKVRLVRREELRQDWDPATDSRLTVWETAQHLIRTLQTEGEPAAAALLKKLGGVGETARELAYRLYSICERKKWADDALAYNGLVTAWPELSKLALSARNSQPATQTELFS